MRTHHDFIISPITQILYDAVASCRCCGNGIETYPLCEYVMQSTFLKMTGFQEQKLKCILWELATDDYEFRYQHSKNSYGECSHYNDKNGIFNDLLNQGRKCNAFEDLSFIDRRRLITEIDAQFDLIFTNSNILQWLTVSYVEYKEFIRGIRDIQLVKKGKGDKYDLFVKSASLPAADKVNNLYDAFDKLYLHRNRCAHNLLSYQNHLPTLRMLANPDYKYENYFIRFYMLALIDQIFVTMWQKYASAIENNVWQ